MVCSMLLLWWYSSITFRPTQWLNLFTALYWRWKTVTTSNEVQSTAAFQSFLWEASWRRVMVPNTAMTLSLLYHNILLAKSWLQIWNIYVYIYILTVALCAGLNSLVKTSSCISVSATVSCSPAWPTFHILSLEQIGSLLTFYCNYVLSVRPVCCSFHIWLCRKTWPAAELRQQWWAF